VLHVYYSYMVLHDTFLSHPRTINTTRRLLLTVRPSVWQRDREHGVPHARRRAFSDALLLPPLLLLLLLLLLLPAALVLSEFNLLFPSSYPRPHASSAHAPLPCPNFSCRVHAQVRR
jgi:hypothetical protein